MIRMVGAMVGAADRADALAHSYELRLDEARARAAELPRRPRVFFEEWDEPLISAIGWVSELVQVAGGDDIFPDRARQGGAQGRIVTHDEVIAGQPEIIIGSWCGKKFQPAKVRTRPGFADVPAVANNRLHEIKSSIILQPGPAALTDGLTAIQKIIESGLKPAD
jgi:iron complex transport system substrate-binding protein